MFNHWVVKVAERCQRRTRGVIPERTLFNHRKGLHGSFRLTKDALAAKFPLLFPDLPGFLSVVVSSGSLGLADDRRVVAFAAELDRLSVRVDELRCRENVPGIREALLGSALLGEGVWAVGRTDLRGQLAGARTLEDLKPVLAWLTYGLFLSTLALLDACFTARAFGAYQPVPLFLLLAPRLKLGTESVGGQGDMVLRPPGKSRRGFRDFVDTPMALFFGMVTALSMLRDAGGGGNWPPEAPRRRDVYRVFSGVADEKELDKLRYGEKRLTAEILERSLGDRFLLEFRPLLFVAHAWEMALLRRQGGPAGKLISALLPDDDYLPFWENHRAALATGGGAAEHGAIPWPDYLLRGQLP